MRRELSAALQCIITSVYQQDYCFQLHFGHYNSKYSDILTSTNYPDGLAGLAIFFEVCVFF